MLTQAPDATGAAAADARGAARAAGPLADARHDVAPAVRVEWLGRVGYADALARQLALRDARLAGEVGDVALLVEHRDVVTFGSRGRGSGAHAQPLDAALLALGYEVHHVRRGGEATYHGPGQLVGYPILDLRPRGLDIAGYLRALEGVLILVARDFGVASRRRPGYTGVWLDDGHKLASIGVGIRRWVTMHGFAVNVSCDLARFHAITPCGLSGVRMVSLASVSGRAPALEDVAERTAVRLRETFA
jgi:lipoyl(octanoyl) transferase